ncbi:L,D-transpeptidase family protein [Gorillibacterium sp. sgz5001074]|uniref:L,D-transpeptidase family protein n=1 Tax=Gorillibacterium sp. sgz5001074 TaxID=3446695 RepID=UPI003F678851
MVKVKDGVYVSRNDPNYYKKVLQYRPDDQEVLYGYASKLSVENNPEAVGVFQRAARYGHAPSIEKLAELKKRTNQPKLYAVPPRPAGKKRSGSMWPLAVSLLLIMLALILILFAFLYQKFIFERTEYHYHYGGGTAYAAPADGSSVQKQKPLSDISGAPAAAPSSAPAWTGGQLQDMVLQAAIEHYKADKGQYPLSLDKLSGIAPDNWISFIPAGIHYKKLEKGYSVSRAGGVIPPFSSGPELFYYPEAQRLGFTLGGRLLALYPVASGSEGNDLPFRESSVGRRVVDPNGGSGVLGTRGLELTEGFAIHGTNDPSSIGRRVTHGCLRMYNKDIESLYPYVTLGTLFKVMTGTPEETPLFGEGLPPVPDWDPDRERTPGTVYHWRA